MELISEVERSFEVAASPDEAYAFLAQVPQSAAHFPDLASFTGGDGTYTWTLREVGVKSISIQLVYACDYTQDPASKTLRWTPVAGVGNGQVRGSWRVEPAEGGSRLVLHNHLTLTLGLPRLLRGVAEGFVVRENTRMIESYGANLVTTLGGGDGRVSAAAIQV